LAKNLVKSVLNIFYVAVVDTDSIWQHASRNAWNCVVPEWCHITNYVHV